MSNGPVRTVTVTGVAEYLKEVFAIAADWDPSPGGIWYRGVRDAYKHTLVPGVVWQSVGDEDSIIEDFLISYRPIHGESVPDPWELYGLVQHYGLPSRLLDWTKSPLLALYFSLEDESGQAEEVDRAVWLIDPYEFNEATVKMNEVFVPRSDHGGDESSGIEIQRYLPIALRGSGEPIPEEPVAIEPPLTNKRMLAQQGCFTVHGSSPLPIDKYFESADQPNHIAKILLPKSIGRGKLRNDLHTIGIREDAVYQDLGALARRIKREWESKK